MIWLYRHFHKSWYC